MREAVECNHPALGGWLVATGNSTILDIQF